ncbi:MAG: D-alanyl-D-alanine carboxypeptidase [Actinomycetota bacterium]|nr:D-alanyl-D-alanine carboxypeptidase [Actinomycetota bacterium]
MRRLVVVAAALVLAASPALAGLPRIRAKAFVVESGTTGDRLAGYRARARVPIASITKLMTVLVALEHARPTAIVTVASGAASVGESTVHLRPGERITVGDLLKAALIQSANDAAQALAYYVGRGSETRFVAMMNARARQLGLRDTRFVRPDGLDTPGHVSSARDVTLLARYVMRKPLVRQIVRQRAAKIGGGRTVHTWNDLLSTFPGVFGVKTGHTTQAGWSEVAAVRRGATTIYATLLGGPDRGTRNADLAALLRWGLARYRHVEAVTAGRTYARVKLGYGKGKLPLVPQRPLVSLVRIDRPLVERVVAPIVVTVPVARGTRLGEVLIFQSGRLLGRRALVAGRKVSRPGLLGRVRWYSGRTVHHAWGWVS